MVTFFIFYTYRVLGHARVSSWQAEDWLPAVDTAPFEIKDLPQFAYVQALVDPDKLCNAVMTLERLHYYQSHADRILVYPREWSLSAGDDTARLLQKAQTEYHARLLPVRVPWRGGDKTWEEMYIKFLGFNQTQYSRVLLLDSDITIRGNMDPLLFTPSYPISMPLAYWADGKAYSPKLILVEPSNAIFAEASAAVVYADHGESEFEVINDLWSEDVARLDHKKYGLLLEEFGKKDHSHYVNNMLKSWDPEAALKAAQVVSFSGEGARKV
jgi:hypothetical protein